MNPELCPTCKPFGKCQFKYYADNIATNVPPLEKQTPIYPDSGGTTEEAAEALMTIMRLRRNAREKNKCPFADYNPDFPGKKILSEHIENLLLEENQRQKPETGAK